MRKLMIIALSFAAATALSHYLLPLALLPAAAGVLLALFFALLLWRRKAPLRLLLVAGALAASLLYNYVYRTCVAGQVAGALGKSREVTACVLDYAEPAGGRWRAGVAVEGTGLQGMLYGGEELCALRPGDRVEGTMTVADAAVIRRRSVTAFTAKGYYLLLYPEEPFTVSPAEGTLRHWPAYAAQRMRETIDRLYGERYAPFLRAILLGDRSRLSDRQGSDLSEAGVYHITSVSGMHCGFLLAVVAALSRRRRGRIFSAAAILLLWVYVCVAGAPASMSRAAVMLTLTLTGPLFGRESDAPTSLSLALMLLLLKNPCAVAGIGMQLSFSAVAGLLIVTPRLCRLLPPFRRTLPRLLGTSLTASLGIAVTTAPLSGFYFNALTLLAPLSNILMLWAAALTFAAGLLSVALGMVLPPLGALLALPAGVGAWYILTLSRLIARIPCHAVYFTNPYLKYWLVYAAALLIYCALTPGGRRRIVLAASLASLTLALTASLPVLTDRGRLRVSAIDVGQGASTFFSAGGASAVVDCGSSGALDPGGSVGDYLNTCGCRRLDYLILTHYHDDHANGAEVLLARVAVDRLLIPLPSAEDRPLHDALVSWAEDCGTAVEYVTEDRILPLGEAVLHVYAPVGRGGTNEEGLSLLCTLEDFDVLVTGDMNAVNERILTASRDLPDIEVLLAGHHGSRTATSPVLLERTAPEVAVISVGADNTYGHPARETLERMARTGMTLYRTDLQGTISITVR